MTVTASLFVAATLALTTLDAASAAPTAGLRRDVNFTSDVLYQIITDRFVDGDPSNNPSGERFSKDCIATELYCGGDWKGIEAKIKDGYLGGLGVTAIMISVPVENIDTVFASKSAAFHGYWPRDLKRNNPAFGSMDDFRSLVATAHAHGMKLMIDFINNQSSPVGNPSFGEDGRLVDDGKPLATFSNDPDGMYHHFGPLGLLTPEELQHGALWEMADMNQQNPRMDAYLKSAIRVWLDMGVDAIRADTVKHMSLAWQRTWMEAIYSHRPVFTAGEFYVPRYETSPDALHFANHSGMSLLDFPFAQALRAVLRYRDQDMRFLDKIITETATGYERPLDQVTFLDNHDQNRFTLSDAPEHRRITEQGLAITLTSRGVPMLYYGIEQYMHGKGHSPHNRARMTSFATDTPAYRISKRLSALRRDNPALQYGTQQGRWVGADVYVFERSFHGNTVLVAVNRDQQKAAAVGPMASTLPCTKGKPHADVLDGAFGGIPISVDCASGTVAPFSLAPGAISVWAVKAAAGAAPGAPQLGHAGPSMLLPGHELTLSGLQFGARRGSVMLDGVALADAAVTGWSDKQVTLRVPALAAGRYRVSLANAHGRSQSYGPLEILAAPQVSLRLVVDEATTAAGESVYAVGEHGPLGADPAEAEYGPMFNQLVYRYPTWYTDVAVSSGKKLAYRFIKKDAGGRVVARESGPAHVFQSPAGGVATHRVRLNGWTASPLPAASPAP